MGRNTLTKIGSLFSLLLILMASPRLAQAYVDPGTGAMLWQIAAAAVLGSLFYVKRAVEWLRKILGMGSREQSSR